MANNIENNNSERFVPVKRRRQHISNEKKKMLIHLYESGVPIIDAAATIKINCNSAYSILKRYRNDGEEFIEKHRGGNRKKILTPQIIKTIEEIVESNPSITLKKIKSDLEKKGMYYN